MEVIEKNMWDYLGIADVICITSNGFVKSSGRAVMGRGCALEAKNRFKDIDLALGYHIEEYGNVPGIIHKYGKTNIVSFPVKRISLIYDNLTENKLVGHMKKRFKLGDRVPGWALKAELLIIELSARLLRSMIDRNKWETVIITKPGCMNGELNWEDVEPILDMYLKDKVICVEKIK